MTDITTSLPHDLTAERSCIGCCLMDYKARITVLSLVRADDFFEPSHAIIYRAIESISASGKIPDYVSVGNYLMQHDQYESAGGAEIYSFTNAVPTVQNAEHYSNIVREASGQRKMIRLGNELASGSMGFEQAQSYMAARLTEIGKVGKVDKALSLNSTFIDSTQYAHDVLTGVKRPPIRMGYPELDRKMSLVPGDMCTIGGWTSTGKTTLAVNFARNVAFNGGAVLFISLEMNTQQIDHKFSAMISNLPGNVFKYGDFYEAPKYQDQFTEYQETLKTIGDRIWIKHKPRASIGEIGRMVKQEMSEHPDICLVIIDYIQLLRLDTTRYIPIVERMTEISQYMKSLPMECDVPLIALSQFSRKDKANPNRPPMLSDFRESGSIEQDSDVCLLLNLQEEQENGQHYNLNEWEIELIVAKGRTDGTGTVPFRLTRNSGIFTEIQEPPL